MALKNKRAHCAVIVTLLSLSLMGCASNCPKLPADSLTLPPPPSESTPQPQVTYSLSAAESERTTRAKLMGTRLMQPPAVQLGQ